MLNADEARALLTYDPETGDLRWKRNRPGGMMAGDLAGKVDTKGYRRVRLNGKDYASHKAAWLITFGVWPEVMDFANGDRTDCRLVNLAQRLVLRNEDGQQIMRTRPLHDAARYAARVAIASGKLVRQPCEECGDPKTDAHHDDYNHPLDVRWLCRSHHLEWHKHNKAREAA